MSLKSTRKAEMQSLGIEHGLLVDGLTKAGIIDFSNSVDSDDAAIGAESSQIEAADEDAFDVEGIWKMGRFIWVVRAL